MRCHKKIKLTKIRCHRITSNGKKYCWQHSKKRNQSGGNLQPETIKCDRSNSGMSCNKNKEKIPCYSDSNYDSKSYYQCHESEQGDINCKKITKLYNCGVYAPWMTPKYKDESVTNNYVKCHRNDKNILICPDTSVCKLYKDRVLYECPLTGTKNKLNCNLLQSIYTCPNISEISLYTKYDNKDEALAIAELLKNTHPNIKLVETKVTQQIIDKIKSESPDNQWHAIHIANEVAFLEKCINNNPPVYYELKNLIYS
jgi:hypothetical protein